MGYFINYASDIAIKAPRGIPRKVLTRLAIKKTSGNNQPPVKTDEKKS